MKIEIHYQTITDVEPQFIQLTPEEYFDPLEEDETSFETSGIARSEFAGEYLNLRAEELKWTDVRIQGKNSDYNVRTEYYKGGHSMWHLRDFDGTEGMCYTSQISDSRQQIIRLHKPVNSSWQVNYHGIWENEATASETEVRFI
jgi:hypothetical protein